MNAQPLHLLIIDPQNDFCDLPPGFGGGGVAALPVPGAHADMQRLARFIRAATPRLAAITVTLDTHHRLDIAHPDIWQDAAGARVPPFTPISAAALRAGAYRPRDAALLPRCQAYVDALEAAGRYTLMIWPVHCEIGTWGHAVHADVQAAYRRWEELGLGPTTQVAQVTQVLKGLNPWTEHYSALQAEVPDTADPSTQLNQSLLQSLAQAELLLVAGEASSHCVKATVEHLAQHLPQEQMARIVLLTDCMSPVAGCEAQQASFFAAMQARGMRLATTAELLERLT